MKPKTYKSSIVQRNLLNCYHSNQSSGGLLSNVGVHVVVEQNSSFCKCQVFHTYCRITQELKFLPFILYWIPLTISAVLYLKQIQDDSKRKVRNRTTECGPLQNDFTLTKCKYTIPICTRLNSYWAGYQLLATHNYINKYDYPTGLLASVFQIDENFKQIYYGALSSNQNHNCCRLVKLSFRALAEFRRFNCSVSGKEHRNNKLTTSIFSLMKRLQKSCFAIVWLNIHLWIKMPSLSSKKNKILWLCWIAKKRFDYSPKPEEN